MFKSPTKQFDDLKAAAAKAREPQDTDVLLNLAFYLDEQYTEYVSASQTGGMGHLNPIADTSKKREYRPIVNKMMHFANQSHAQALQTKPMSDVLPATDNESDASEALVAQAYLDYLSDPQVENFDSKLSQSVLWAIIGGEGYLKWSFDAEDKKRPVITVASPLDVYPDPYATDFANARYVIHSQFLDVEQVYHYYNIEVKPESISRQDAKASAVLRKMGYAPVLSGVVVNEIWMRPSRRYPNGRYAVWTPKKLLIEPQDHPYAHKRIPFTQLGVIPRPGVLHYASALKYLRSAQMELNRYHAQRIMVRENFANVKWWIPTDLELEEMPNDAPNQILRGDSQGGTLRPELIQGSMMPGGDEGTFISDEMMNIVGLHEVSQAQVPGRVEAAKAIEMLREADDSRLAELNRTINAAISEGFWQILQLAKQFVSDEVIAQTYSREGVPEVKRFKTNNFSPGMRIRVTSQTGLARTRAGRQDQILMLWQNKILQDPKMVAQLLDLPMPTLDSSDSKDIERAKNENIELSKGIAIKPNSWDNHSLHMQEHNNYRKTTDYNGLPLDTKQKFEHHCSEHETLEVEMLKKQIDKQAMIAQLTQPQPQPQPAQESAPPA